MEYTDLQKFLSEKNIEMRWDGEVLSTWIAPWEISEFAQLFESAFSDGGREVTLLADGFIWVDLVPLCEYYGIEPEKVFSKTEN